MAGKKSSSNLHLARDKHGATFGTIVALIGSILIVCGVAWLIATNWHQIPSALKIIILVMSTAIAYAAGVGLRIIGHPGIGKSLLVLGALLYTLSIFLIAQIFSTSVSLQGTAFLILLAWIGVFLATYIFDSPASLFIALVEFLFWLVLQYGALTERLEREFSFGIIALIFLAAGILLYGLSLVHKKHKFSRVYQGWTVLYFLLFSYILSFQTILPLLWSAEANFSPASLTFLIVLSILSLIILFIGAAISIKNKAVSGKELVGFFSVVILLIIIISIAALVTSSIGVCTKKSCYSLRNQQTCSQAPSELNCEWKNSYCMEKNCYNYNRKEECESADVKLKCSWINYSASSGSCSTNNTEPIQVLSRYDDPTCSKYNERKSCVSNELCTWQPIRESYWFRRGKSAPLSLWFIWIMTNIIFLAIILTVIGYGSWTNSPGMINLGIGFFVLDIITRYIGFMMDLWGYTSLSIIFITGGIVLILGGWFIETWRRKLIHKVREEHTPETRS